MNRLATYCWDISLNQDKYVKTFNLGISGENIIGVRARVASEFDARLNEDKALIIFAVGINDTKIEIKTGQHKTDLETYERLLNELVDISQKKKAECVLLGLTPIDEERLDPIPWRPGFAYRMSEVKKFDLLIEKVARERKVGFIPMQDALGSDYQKLLPDGLHPGSEGHKRIFERVRNYLENEDIFS